MPFVHGRHKANVPDACLPTFGTAHRLGARMSLPVNLRLAQRHGQFEGATTRSALCIRTNAVVATALPVQLTTHQVAVTPPSPRICPLETIVANSASSTTQTSVTFPSATTAASKTCMHNPERPARKPRQSQSTQHSAPSSNTTHGTGSALPSGGRQTTRSAPKPAGHCSAFCAITT